VKKKRKKKTEQTRRARRKGQGQLAAEWGLLRKRDSGYELLPSIGGLLVFLWYVNTDVGLAGCWLIQ